MTTLCWNGRLLTAGGRDQMIRHIDIRLPTDTYRRHSSSIGLFQFHTHEVCGLAWDLSGRFLASGGNDNMICVWDIRRTSGQESNHAFSTEHSGASVQSQYIRRNSIQDSVRETSSPLFVWYDHMAAVKALDWCPHKPHMLASGGGTLDKRLNLWDVTQGIRLASIDTGSQICNMKWSPYHAFHEFELVTTHGFTQNQLVLWKISPFEQPWSNSSAAEVSKSLVPLIHIKGHTQRVVHMAVNPNTAQITTGSGDETLRFWDTFGSRNQYYQHIL
jgi:cell division cycle 20-like protein 1, cofactor of APC complex